MSAFMMLDLDMASLGRIFQLLDTEKNGTVDLAILVEGCYRLRGSAKVVDMATLECQIEELLFSVNNIEQLVADSISQLEGMAFSPQHENSHFAASCVREIEENWCKANGLSTVKETR